MDRNVTQWRLLLPPSPKLLYNCSMSQHQSEEPVVGRYIEVRSTRRGVEKPFIVGTRIGVETIYACHELQGMTPDDIVESYPQLTLPQIHAALAYYFERPEEIRVQLAESEAYAASLEQEVGATKYSEQRDAYLSKDAGEDPVSS